MGTALTSYALVDVFGVRDGRLLTMASRDARPGTPKWRWERIDPGRTGASGDLAKIFKNDPVKSPGVFAPPRAPAPEAALLVREVIQNSWDAALESREGASWPTGAPPFKLRFRFDSVSGKQRDAIVEHLGLQELAFRARFVGARRSLGLSESDCLASLDGDDELSLLYITEEAAGGMHGPWNGDDSKLYLALCSIGITPDTQERGGSYGYGKAGLIRGSRIRSVIAYTCFAERRETDTGVTRRLLGMTYWGQHKLGDVSYTGSARFDSPDPKSPDINGLPFINEAADRIAERLGMPIRSPGVPADLGTTILLLQPTVRAGDLVAATERYWWPALMEPSLRFNVEVVDETGRIHHPKPNSNEDLRPFITAYEGAMMNQDNSRDNLRVKSFRAVGEYPDPGTLGIVADNPGWSYPQYTDSDSDVDHKSLIALVRKPRMVVEYYEAGRIAPYVRGTFVASDSINEPLRLTEPKSHDAWQTTSASGDIPHDYAELSRTVLQRIEMHVNRFRRDLKPKPKPAEDLRLPEFDRIMRRLLAGSAPGATPPLVDKRPLSIRPGGRIKAAADGRLYLQGTAEIEFSEHYHAENNGQVNGRDENEGSEESKTANEEGEEVEVSIRYRFVEDNALGEYVELEVESPHGFNRHPDRADTFRGRLKPGIVAEFQYLSDEYDSSWTGKLSVDAELISAEDS